MQKGNIIYKQRAIGLLELMLALGIIAILLVMATRYFHITRLANEVNNATGMIEALHAASTRWITINDGSVADISIEALLERNLVPASFDKNPWGGDILVTGNEQGQVKFSFLNIPYAACNSLQDRFDPATNPETVAKEASCKMGMGNISIFTAIF